MTKEYYKNALERQADIARKLYEENIRLKEKLKKEKELNDLLIEKIGGTNEKKVYKKRIS